MMNQSHRVYETLGIDGLITSRLSPAQIQRVFAQAQGSKTPSKSGSSTPSKPRSSHPPTKPESPFATPSFLRGGSTTKAWSVEDSELFNEQTIFSPAAAKPAPKMEQFVESHVILDSPLLISGDLPIINFENNAVDLEPIGQLAIPEQERAIIDDLLYVIMVSSIRNMQGMQGDYIKRESLSPFTSTYTAISSVKYTLDPSLDTSLSDLVRRILPLATHTALIQEYTTQASSYSAGRCGNALASALSQIHHELLLLVAQLEGESGLPRLYYYLGPSIATMQVCNSLVIDIISAGPIVGSALLNIISQRRVMASGDANAVKIMTHLEESACAPYILMLTGWIDRGVIDGDEWGEFCIDERGDIEVPMTRAGVLAGKGDGDIEDWWWESRYTLKGVVSLFLKGVEGRVLLAGKYLNVLRACGGDVKGAEKAIEQFVGRKEAVIDHSRFWKQVDVAYTAANRGLLDMLFNQQCLVARLWYYDDFNMDSSIKRYFLLDQSDYLTPFLDLALPDLTSLAASKVSISKMRSLLEVVLGNPASVCANDLYKDDLDVEFGNANLFDQMERINSVSGGEAPPAQPKHSNNVKGMFNFLILGVDAFHLAYKVSFPLSIVLSQGVIVKYQLIFRFLFLCKYVDYRLNSGWVGQVWSRPRGAPAKKTTTRPPLTPKRSGIMTPERKATPVRRATSHGSLTHPQIKTLNEVKPRLCVLSNRMSVFIQQFLYYACYEVIEPNWKVFVEGLGACESVEGLIASQHGFLDSVVRECMLSNTKLLKVCYWGYLICRL
jgi:gamma-tubulin complex component 2